MNPELKIIEQRLARLDELVKRIMPGKLEPYTAGHEKIVVGRDEICRVYGFGRQTFYWLLEKGAPIKQMGSRYFVHRDSLDAFFLEMTREGATVQVETKRPAGAGRKTKKR